MPRWYCLKRLGSSFSSSPAEASPARASCITMVSRSSSSTCRKRTQFLHHGRWRTPPPGTALANRDIPLGHHCTLGKLTTMTKRMKHSRVPFPMKGGKLTRNKLTFGLRRQPGQNVDGIQHDIWWDGAQQRRHTCDVVCRFLRGSGCMLAQGRHSGRCR